MSYTAFLSYSHEDELFARRFHRQLESWKVSSDLIGRETRNGVIKSSLRPIFRDREDFAGGSSLKDATLQALKDSRFLIVLCSPHAAKSEYVTEEVRLFKAMGRADKVIPVILAGEPNNPERECFPNSVKFQVGEDGVITEDEASPIAADARDVGDGRSRGLAKVVAGILGLPFDEIIRRAERSRRNRNAFWIGIAVGAFVFATAFASFALYQNYQSRVSIEKSVFAIGGLIQETDRLGVNDIDQTRAKMLRTQCDLIEGLSSEPSQIGSIEKTICLSQQAHAVHEIGEKGKAIKGLHDWLVLRQHEFDSAQSPSFDQALSMVKAAQEVANLSIQMTDEVGQTIKILSELVAIADMAGRKRPDIESIRMVHDGAVWKLIEALESRKDFKASLEVMQHAASLRKLQTEAEQDHIALFDHGVFLRRIAWMMGTHYNDHPQALEIARKAVATFDTLSGQVEPNFELYYQTSLSYQVLADELYQNGDFEISKIAYKTALVNLEHARSHTKSYEGSEIEVADQIKYLTEKVQSLEP